jgi:regulator of sigma E protease
MTAIAFILIFLGVVLVHEWGHFYVARKCGMRVLEFGFGLPPRIKGIKKGETLYSINALPIGGFVRIAGENGLDDESPIEVQFESKPWYKKSAVLVAGVIMNVILGFVLFFISYLSGVPTLDPQGTPTVISLSAGLPAQEAGLRIGDTIRSITDQKGAAVPIETAQLHEYLQTHEGGLVVEYTSAGSDTARTLTLTPVEQSGNRMIGISIERISNTSSSVGHALGYAWHQTVSTLGLIFVTVAHLIAGLFSHPSAEGLVGPVGLVKVVGDATRIGFGYLLALAATISINLAAVNILPFPALDGGRLIIVLLEALTRRKFSQKVVGWIHAGGFLLLIGLFILLTIHDIRG